MVGAFCAMVEIKKCSHTAVCCAFFLTPITQSARNPATYRYGRAGTHPETWCEQAQSASEQRSLRWLFYEGFFFNRGAEGSERRSIHQYATERAREATKSKGKYRRKIGVVAQLGEHLPCTQGVGSSILPGSTNKGI